MSKGEDNVIWYTHTFEKNDIPNLKDKGEDIPEFQRGPAWSIDKQIELIYTIKNDLPFGCVLLYCNKSKKSKLGLNKKNNVNNKDFYKVIDGQQRCNTIFKFMDKPNTFFSTRNIEDKVVKDMISVFNKEKIKDEYELCEKIKSFIIKYVRDKDEWKQIQYIEFAKNFYEEHSKYYNADINIRQEEERIGALVKPVIVSFNNFVNEVSRKIKIPAIIYEGKEEYLPEIFININSMGVPLTKFDLYSSSWIKESIILDENTSKEEIQNDKEYISNIIDFIVNKYNTRQEDENNFSFDDYAVILDEIEENKKVKLFDAIYGFGKYICSKYKNLFNGSSKPEIIDSIGFNLVTSCLGYKINQIKDLPRSIKECNLKDDVDVLLCRIIECIDEVENAINCIVNGKNNSKGTKEWDKVYQTPAEYQICSLVASYFINKYVELEFDAEGKITNKIIHLNQTNNNWEEYKERFYKYAKIKYVCDILKSQWKGSGDSKLYNIILNSKYYTNEINEEEFREEIDTWYKGMNESRQEVSRVSPPKEAEKVLLMIIYSQLPTSQFTDKSLKFEIEHIAPKKQMIEKMAKYNGELALPIGSFGNLCYLTHKDNQAKKHFNIYQARYDNKFSDEDIEKIEKYYTFTKAEDLGWMNISYSIDDKDMLENDYKTYVDQRYKKLRKKIINILYDKLDEE